MISVDEIYACLAEAESPILEFKRDWYWDDLTPIPDMAKKWGELQKDLISLSNGYINYCGENRYLIIGYSEVDKKIHSLDTSKIKKLKDAAALKAFKKEIIAKLEKLVVQPILNVEIEMVLIDGQNLLAFKIPSPLGLTVLKNDLQTKTSTIPAGVVLIRKGQDQDSVRAATPYESSALTEEFLRFKETYEKQKIKADNKRDRSIKNTMELYIDKNGSLTIDEGYTVTHKNWNENILFELFKINQQFSDPQFFLYIHENSAQNKTYEYLKSNSLIDEKYPLIILTERPADLKDLDKRKTNLKSRFKTDHVFFIDEFGYKNLYCEHMLEYMPYRLENYVAGVADIGSDEKKTALEQLKSWYQAVSNPLMVIKGYGGIGKTTLVKQFLDFVHDSKDDAGILFIDSNEIIDELIKIARLEHRIDDIYDFYLAQMKKEDFDGKGFSKELLKLSVDNGNLLIVLDGIDEVIAKLGAGFDVSEFITSISTNYSSNLERTKIIITCRDYFWDSLQDKIKVEEITLEPFSEALAQQFFEKYFSSEKAKVLKAMKMAADFRLSTTNSDSDLIYIPYVLDMVAYLVKQHEEFGENEIHYKSEAKLLASNIPNDFLILSVCEREVEKLGNFEIDDQVEFLMNLSMCDDGYITDYNIKSLSLKAIDDLTIEKLKAHPLVRFSKGKMFLRYDFFYEYFKGLYIYNYYVDLETSRLDDKLIELVGSYVRYGNQLSATLCRKLTYNEDLVLFTIESIDRLKSILKECEPSEKTKLHAAMSSLFVLIVSLLRETDDIKFDVASATELLITVFGDSNNEISDLVLMNVLAGDSKKLSFDFRGKTIKNSHFERYDYFWDCLIDLETRFVRSSFSQLDPRKGLRPTIFPNTFDECDTSDIQNLINQRADEDINKNEKNIDNIRKLFELFYKRGNFYPMKQQYIKSKTFTGNVLPVLIKNSVIQDYVDEKKPTLRQYKVNPDYRGLLKYIEQGTPCIELDRVIDFFK